MSKNSGIEWTDHTFNPWWGCTKVKGSPACAFCYAETGSKRWGHTLWGDNAPRRFFSESHWSEPLKWAKEARKEGVRRKVFCASYGDWLERHPMPGIARKQDEERKRLAGLVKATEEWLIWQFLTKRIENADSALSDLPGDSADAMLRQWWGVTTENEDNARRRVSELLKIPSAIHFASYEPALGPIDFFPWLGDGASCCGDSLPHAKLDWIIAGGESGENARPAHPDWFRTVRNDCEAAGVAFFFKQWGEWTPGENVDDLRSYKTRTVDPDTGESRRCSDDWVTEADGTILYRVGKKKAGRQLDGREYSEFPGNPR